MIDVQQRVSEYEREIRRMPLKEIRRRYAESLFLLDLFRVNLSCSANEIEDLQKRVVDLEGQLARSRKDPKPQDSATVTEEG